MEKFANREVCDLIFVDYKSKKPVLNMDYANTTTTEVTGEAVYAYGGQGHPKRVVFTGDKGGTIAFETQMQTMALWALVTGAGIKNTAKFLKREVIVADAEGSLTLKENAEAGTINVFTLEDDCGTPIPGSATEKVFTATSASDIAAGESYVAYYLYNMTNVQSLNIKSTTFAKDMIVYGSTFQKTEEGEILDYKMTVYKCTPQPSISVGMSNSGDPATITITCDMMADKDNNMLDLILCGPEEE